MAKTERGVMPNDRDSTSILRDDQDLEKVCELVALFFRRVFFEGCGNGNLEQCKNF